jgi:hypothetical protein
MSFFGRLFLALALLCLATLLPFDKDLTSDGRMNAGIGFILFLIAFVVFGGSL